MYALPPQNKNKNQIGGYENMDSIKLLNELKVGTPLIITTKWQDRVTREVALYGGTDGMGTYIFVDEACGVWKITTGYIKEHCTISQELDGEDDLLKLTKIIEKVKGEKGVK